MSEGWGGMGLGGVGEGWGGWVRGGVGKGIRGSCSSPVKNESLIHLKICFESDLLGLNIHMSSHPSQLVSHTLEEISQWVSAHGAILSPTKWDGVYIIKFDPQTDATHPDILRLRGLIFHHPSHKILAIGHPVPTEFKDVSPEGQKIILTNVLGNGNYRVEEALDGTLLRLWWGGETCLSSPPASKNTMLEGGGSLSQWVLSTNNKEDASDAFWMNNISFAQQFWDAYPGFRFDLLNPHYVYLFRLCHPLNVIVVNHTVPRIYHVTTYDRQTLQEVNCDLGFDLPTQFPGMTVEEVVHQTQESCSQPVQSAGWMVSTKSDVDGVIYRIRFENHNYTQARVLRGDSNNLDFVLLSVGRNPEQLSAFLRFYPIYLPRWTWLCHRLEELTQELYYGYRQRLTREGGLEVKAIHRSFLRDLHQEIYLQFLQPKRQSVQVDDVRRFLFQQPPARLCHLLGGN